MLAMLVVASFLLMCLVGFYLRLSIVDSTIAQTKRERKKKKTTTSLFTYFVSMLTPMQQHSWPDDGAFHRRFFSI